MVVLKPSPSLYFRAQYTHLILARRHETLRPPFRHPQSWQTNWTLPNGRACTSISALGLCLGMKGMYRVSRCHRGDGGLTGGWETDPVHVTNYTLSSTALSSIH